MNLRYLTRQHESLTGMYVQAKLQFQAILDQVFPEYHGVFSDLYSKVSLRFLALHPTSKEVLELDEREIAATIGSPYRTWQNGFMVSRARSNLSSSSKAKSL
ncbi:hypothetical protein QFZ78_001121 [Paenibacillus sp. V4I5]|nr:hypothetical protein [Paenibacillus sp. V4I5]